MKIVCLDGYPLNPGDNPWDGVSAHGELTVYDRTTPEEVLERARGAHVLLTNKTPVSAETIARLPELRLVSVLATGYDVVDIEAAGKRGIPVCNIPVYGTDSVAQFVFAMLLDFCHHVPLHDTAVKQGEWAQNPDWSFWKTPLVELAGLTMGIVGFGRIGRRVGELAHAFHMNVIAHDVYTGNPPAYEPFGFRALPDLFREADIVTLHCNLTPENRHMVNRETLGLMKRNAILVNASRGPLVHDADLADALNTGRIAGAALDVVSVEPIRPENPLLHAKNCLITPHMAWATLSARKRLMAATAGNIAAFVAGKPQNVVNGKHLG